MEISRVLDTPRARVGEDAGERAASTWPSATASFATPPRSTLAQKQQTYPSLMKALLEGAEGG